MNSVKLKVEDKEFHFSWTYVEEHVLITIVKGLNPAKVDNKEIYPKHREIEREEKDFNVIHL